MKYRILATPVFENDLKNIFEFIATDNLNKGVEVINNIKKEILNLSEFPFMGTEKKKLGVKFRFLIVYDYIVYYSVNKKQEEIILKRALHSAKFKFTLE